MPLGTASQHCSAHSFKHYAAAAAAPWQGGCRHRGRQATLAAATVCTTTRHVCMRGPSQHQARTQLMQCNIEHPSARIIVEKRSLKMAIFRVHSLQNDTAAMLEKAERSACCRVAAMGADCLPSLQGGRDRRREGVWRRRLGVRAPCAPVAGGADRGAGLWRRTRWHI